MQKKYRGPKLRPTVSENRKLREIVRKKGKVPLYSYFHPQTQELWECWLVEWAFALKFQLWVKRSFWLFSWRKTLVLRLGCAFRVKHYSFVLNLVMEFILSLRSLSDWFLVNRRGFGPQGVKQVVIFRFAFVWIKWRIIFIIIKGNAWINPYWLPLFRYFILLGDSRKG